jgi:hypothetical protein
MRIATIFHIRGWHRLGIVASAIWILAAGFYLRSIDTQGANDVFEASYEFCADRQRLLQGRDPAYIADVDRCAAQAVEDRAAWVDGGWSKLAIVTLSPIPVGWGFAYLALVVVARRKGASSTRA